MPWGHAPRLPIGGASVRSPWRERSRACIPCARPHALIDRGQVRGAYLESYFHSCAWLTPGDRLGTVRAAYARGKARPRLSAPGSPLPPAGMSRAGGHEGVVGVAEPGGWWGAPYLATAAREGLQRAGSARQGQFDAVLKDGGRLISGIWSEDHSRPAPAHLPASTHPHARSHTRARACAHTPHTQTNHPTTPPLPSTPLPLPPLRPHPPTGSLSTGK